MPPRGPFASYPTRNTLAAATNATVCPATSITAGSHASAGVRPAPTVLALLRVVPQGCHRGPIPGVERMVVCKRKDVEGAQSRCIRGRRNSPAAAARKCVMSIGQDAFEISECYVRSCERGLESRERRARLRPMDQDVAW